MGQKLDGKKHRKKITLPKSFAQCRKNAISYLTRRRRTIAYALPNAITYLNTCISILIHASPILIHWLGFRLHILIHASPIFIHWVGFRLSAPCLNTCIAYTLSRLLILIHTLPTDTTRQPIRIEHEKSSYFVSQSHEKTHQPRQPIRIE